VFERVIGWRSIGVSSCRPDVWLVSEYGGQAEHDLGMQSPYHTAEHAEVVSAGRGRRVDSVPDMDLSGRLV